MKERKTNKLSYFDRYLIASHTTDYQHPMLFFNTVAVFVLVVAKFPHMHKVRIFGINADQWWMRQTSQNIYTYIYIEHKVFDSNLLLSYELVQILELAKTVCYFDSSKEFFSFLFDISVLKTVLKPTPFLYLPF